MAQRTLFALADGCNWGNRSRTAAHRALNVRDHRLLISFNFPYVALYVVYGGVGGTAARYRLGA